MDQYGINSILSLFVLINRICSFLLYLGAKYGIINCTCVLIYDLIFHRGLWDAEWYDFELIGLSDDGNSIIGFWVDKYRSTDDDNDSSSSLVPFQVAYAVSIHKAQGL